MNYVEKLTFEQKQEYYAALCEMISPERVSLFEKVIEERTDMQCVVVENIYQSQNASAVLRTCDCVGIQQVHVIENNNTYQINPDVALGSSQWIDLHRYNRKENNTLDCIIQREICIHLVIFVFRLPKSSSIYANIPI